jgi:hypothetical protein
MPDCCSVSLHVTNFQSLSEEVKNELDALFAVIDGNPETDDKIHFEEDSAGWAYEDELTSLADAGVEGYGDHGGHFTWAARALVLHHGEVLYAAKDGPTAKILDGGKISPQSHAAALAYLDAYRAVNPTCSTFDPEKQPENAVSLQECAETIEDLKEWASALGGFEAPVWERVNDLLARLRGGNSELGLY